MDKKQYNNIIDWTQKTQPETQTVDSLTAVRAVCNNMGVALPQGDLAQVAETLATDDYMGWKACTQEEAQEAANNGIPAIGVGNQRIVLLAADDNEQPVTATASVMTLAKDNVSTATVSMSYYTYSGGTTVYRMLVKHQTENDCYKASTSIGDIKGIVVHSTGVNNPNLKRYVDFPEELGDNTNNNHWNQSNIKKMVHAFIGYDKNKNVAIVNTLPYTYACWGCGNGENGSYNYPPTGHIQFEICEDNKENEAYFNSAVFGAAVQYCAYLCKTFSLPVNSIVSHKEAHDLGYASNHGDPENWLTIHNKTMDDFRSAVQAKLCL